MSYYIIAKDDYLMHHGIKGQRWGIRRWQNEDGSLTPEGARKYGTVENFNYQRARKKRIARNVGIGIGAATAVGLGTAAFLNSGAGQNLRKDIQLTSALKKSLKKEGNLDKTYNMASKFMDINAGPNASRRTKMMGLAAQNVFNKQAAKATTLAKAKGALQGAYEYATDKENGAQKVMSDAVKQAGKTAVNTAVQTLAGKGTKMVTEAAIGAVASKGRNAVNKYFGEQAGSYMFQNPNKKQ